MNIHERKIRVGYDNSRVLCPNNDWKQKSLCLSDRFCKQVKLQVYTEKTSKRIVLLYLPLSAYLSNSDEFNIHGGLIIIIIHVSMETYLSFIFDSLSFTFRQIWIIMFLCTRERYNGVLKRLDLSGISADIKVCPLRVFHSFSVKRAFECISAAFDVSINMDTSFHKGTQMTLL